MLEKVLRPFTFVISRLKYSQKFLLVSMLFVIPVILLFTIWVTSQNEEIRLLEKEHGGVDQIQQLLPFALRVQEHRGLVNGYLNGNEAVKEQIEVKQTEIARTIEEINKDFNQSELPGAFQQWGALVDEWEKLKGNYIALQPADSFNQHSALINELLSIIKVSSDESHLTLDEDINSYYLMSMIVHELPGLIENTAILRGKGNGVLSAGVLSSEVKSQMSLEQARSEENLENLMKSIAWLAESNKNINKELITKSQQSAEQVKTYIMTVEQEILNKDRFILDADAYFKQGTSTISSFEEVYQQVVLELQQMLDQRISTYQTERSLVVLVSALSLLLVFLFYLAFYRSVLETVRILKNRAEAMSNGDFSKDIKLNTKDELQEVGAAFNEMQNALRAVFIHNQQIAQLTLNASQQLTEIAAESTLTMKQVASSVQGVSEGTVSQKRTTGEVSTAMNEMSTGISRIAEAASEVAFVASRTNENAVEGDEQLGQTVKQMEHIQQSQAHSIQIVTELSQHSAVIEKIIQSIMEIAGQTKLLALNANIEAARAGEHGRGFSIVAKEVGKLAEETSRSGQSISKLLGDIQGLVRETVGAMDIVQEETNTGLDSIHRSKEMIDHILNDVRKVSEQIQEVSATSEELSAEMEQITASVIEISDISHQTSDEAETMAAASEEQLASMEQIQSSAKELRDFSERLQKELSRFRLS